MKKLHQFMDKLLDRLEARWQALPIRKQRIYTLLFFFGYTLLTAGAILTAWNSADEPNRNMVIEHIENPATGNKDADPVIQDTLLHKYQ